jgi:hypothetical protein
MAARRISNRRTNILRGRRLEGRISEACRAPAETVYDLLVDIERHLQWGGTMRSRGSRLLSIEAPTSAATVGTEFSSAGEDSIRWMRDRSVVTEAMRPRAFEFVTESSSRLKRSAKRADWTIVHRYDLAPGRDGCRITYRYSATRATSLPGSLALFRVPVLRSVALRISMAELRGGLRNLIRMAEEDADSQP